jgi:hypothetical protein
MQIKEIKIGEKILTRVSALQDDSSHWYVLPYGLTEQFMRDVEDEDMADSGEFDKIYGAYRTGGGINNVELYGEINK